MTVNVTVSYVARHSPITCLMCQLRVTHFGGDPQHISALQAISDKLSLLAGGHRSILLCEKG